MNKKLVEKLNKATLTKKEFNYLLFLDRKIYIETARERFAKLGSHLNPNHIDWKLRIKANEDLAFCLRDYINKNLSYLKKLESIKIIELGASLGAITTLFNLRELAKFNLLKKSKIWLIDINKKGLIQTKKLNFDLDLIIKRGIFGRDFDTNLLKSKLKSANIIEANILKLPKNLPKFDIVLSGFVHHHLNITDKKLACIEMERITKKNGFLGIGDLYFTYKRFIEWLRLHKKEFNEKKERIPYAVESFIPMKKHISFFRFSDLQYKSKKNKYYVFYLKRQ